VKCNGKPSVKFSFGSKTDNPFGGQLVKVSYMDEEKSMKAQMKRADKVGATKVLILGEDEVKEGKIVLKDFATGTQEKYDINEILNILKK
jgi:histidyl-tRNA synthetase